MKKVLLSAAISATLGLTALPSMAQDVDLRMSWWGGNGRHQVTLKALEEFHKQNPDINVKAEYTGWDGHLSRLTTQIAGGTEPDVMQTNWNWLPIFSKNGDGFYDLNKMKDVIDLTQFDPKELQSTTVNGKLNGIPISVTARVFYFNDETWKKAGVEYPKTWDALMAAGKALGFTPTQVMVYVILPQAFRNMIPVFMTQTIILFQDTSLVYAIGAYDLLKGFEIAGKNFGRPIETYLLAAVTYFLICFTLSRIVRRIQQKVAIIR
jgi:ABC-type glycerol-3-phosphate transport system substrate-binding protein